MPSPEPLLQRPAIAASASAAKPRPVARQSTAPRKADGFRELFAAKKTLRRTRRVPLLRLARCHDRPNDGREDIKLFVKRPAKFKIDTPVGPYNSH